MTILKAYVSCLLFTKLKSTASGSEHSVHVSHWGQNSNSSNYLWACCWSSVLVFPLLPPAFNNLVPSFLPVPYWGHTAMNKKKPPKILITYQFSCIQTQLFICNFRFSHWCFQDLSARMLCHVNIPAFHRINFSVKQSKKISTVDRAEHLQDLNLQNLFLKYSISYYPSIYTKFWQTKSL